MTAQEKRRAKTRKALLTQARRLFVKHGYADTTTQMILDAADLSKGALYHHFDSKEDLFAAIYHDVSLTAIETAMKTAGATPSPLENLKRAAFAWLEQIRNPATARLLLEIGPQALGAARAKKIEDANSLSAMTASLQQAVQVGEITISSPPVSARLLSALLAEAAYLYHQYGDKEAPHVDDMLSRFFEGLK